MNASSKLRSGGKNFFNQENLRAGLVKVVKK